MDLEELQAALDRRMASHIELMADLAEALGIDPKDKTTWPQSWLDEITVIDAARMWLNPNIQAAIAAWHDCGVPHDPDVDIPIALAAALTPGDIAPGDTK